MKVNVRSVLRLGGALLAAVAALSAATLEVRNDHGAIRIEVVASPDLEIQGSVGARPARDDETVITRQNDRLILTAKPADDSAPLDLAIRLPLGFDVEAQTAAGEISIVGMAHRVRLYTDTGLIFLKIPWAGARLQLDADLKPAKVSLPAGRRFLDSTIDVSGGKTLWRLRDNLAESAVVYGTYRIRAGRPAEAVLEDFDPPPGWPLKFHWQAPRALEAISRRPVGPAPSRPSKRRPRTRAAPAAKRCSAATSGW